MLVEISSYPKCGNTWMRYIISTYFSVNVHTGIPDVHQQNRKTKELIEYIKVNNTNVGFYKSHVTDSPQMNPDKIICIYRHPLDVFLSNLNYFYITGRKDMFEDEAPVSVDALVKNGRFNYYFQDFIEKVGSNYYVGLLGNKSDYFEYLRNALSNSKVTAIKYEDLYDSPSETIRNVLFKTLNYDSGAIDESVFVRVNKNTKYSNNPFYWKATKSNYNNYLSVQQINKFISQYNNELRWLGYC